MEMARHRHFDARRGSPSIDEIRQRTSEVFHVRPCLWQAKAAQAILRGDSDIVLIAGTGMGKTLVFWIPLLFSPPGSVQIVVTPLNILGKQNVNSLKEAGLRAIFIGGKTATYENFTNIQDLQYHVVIITPEQLMKPSGGFAQLCKLPTFTKHIISIIFDEAHCISQWASFRPEYKEVGRLRYILTRPIPIVLASATLPEPILKDIKQTLNLQEKDLTVIRCPGRRPNITICVRPITVGEQDQVCFRPDLSDCDGATGVSGTASRL